MLVEIATPQTRSASLEAHRISSLPVLVLDLHSRCNCRCVMCDIWKRDSAQELPLEILMKERESLRALKVEWVVLSGGEPLLHSGFQRLCAFLREEGIRVTLLTAGIGLQKRARDIASGVDDVIVSLDGPPAIHDHIRGINGAYNHLATGVLSLLSMRPELRITARTTVQKSNHAYLRATVAAAQELDLSGISFLAADLTSEAFNRELPWEEAHAGQVALSPAEVDTLDREVEELIVECDREIRSGYIAEKPEKLRRIVRHFRAHLGQQVPQAPICNAPWVSAVIGHDGSVRPCFFHPEVGNVRHQSLDEAINGFSAVNFRDSLNIAENPTCRRCVCSLNRPAT